MIVSLKKLTPGCAFYQKLTSYHFLEFKWCKINIDENATELKVKDHKSILKHNIGGNYIV